MLVAIWVVTPIVEDLDRQNEYCANADLRLCATLIPNDSGFAVSHFPFDLTGRLEIATQQGSTGFPCSLASQLKGRSPRAAPFRLIGVGGYFFCGWLAGGTMPLSRRYSTI